MKTLNICLTSALALFTCGVTHAGPPNNIDTSTGYQALNSDPKGGTYNTADGYQALFDNTTGKLNTATGYQALYSNTTGGENVANGGAALYSNTTGYDNTATGQTALFYNTTGTQNTATGRVALYFNTTGGGNTATGFVALGRNTIGSNNTAFGAHALNFNTTGSSNIAMGDGAGYNLTTGDNNIDVGNQGAAADASTIRIGTQGTQTQTFLAGIFGATVAAGGVPVYVDANGTLGTMTSSQRYKRDIEDMGSSSEAILALRPVTFRYKTQIDPSGTPQFGLVAEEVEKVSSNLVVYDSNHRVYSVRYEAVNAMLLNEFRKQHDVVLEQQKEIAALTARFDALEKASANK